MISKTLIGMTAAVGMILGVMASAAPASAGAALVLPISVEGTDGGVQLASHRHHHRRYYRPRIIIDLGHYHKHYHCHKYKKHHKKWKVCHTHRHGRGHHN